MQELIRFDSPVQIISRIAKEDIEICNVNKKDSYILLNIGAANRDPEQFHNPNILNLKEHINQICLLELGHIIVWVLVLQSFH